MKSIFVLLLLPLAAYAQDLQTGITFADGDTVHGSSLNNAINNSTILPTFYGNKGVGSPVSGDLFLFYQSSTSSLKQAQLGALFSAGLSYNTQAANTFLAGPINSTGAPTFRKVYPYDTAMPTDTTVSTTFDASLARTFKRILTANTTYTIVNMVDGETITISIQQAATGGPWTSAVSGVTWKAGTAYTQTTTASKKDLITVIKIGSDVLGNVSQNY